jgi:hypothetical protein
VSKQLQFRRRIGPDPNKNGLLCSGCRGCPDIWELDNGDFAIIGVDITAEAISNLPQTVGCAPDERIIRLPRKLLVNAKGHIPDTL